MNSLSEAVCMRSVLQAVGLLCCEEALRAEDTLRCEAALCGGATWLP